MRRTTLQHVHLGEDYSMPFVIHGDFPAVARSSNPKVAAIEDNFIIARAPGTSLISINGVRLARVTVVSNKESIR